MDWLTSLIDVGKSYLDQSAAKAQAKNALKAQALQFRRDQLALQQKLAAAKLTSGSSSSALDAIPPWALLAAAGVGVYLLVRK